MSLMSSLPPASEGSQVAVEDAGFDVDQVVELLSARGEQLADVMARAAHVRDEGLRRAGRPGIVTYSRKVFVPVTTLCRDRCHYCAFVDTPARLEAKGIDSYLSPERVLAIVRQGQAAGCKEALLTLGDRPEDRWPIARAWLDEHGFASTVDYVGFLADLIRRETGLLAHLNPGVLSAGELATLRPTAPSMGMMLESTSRTIFEQRGGAHFGSPDKDPEVRLRALHDAGRARIAFTTGLLIGIGETLRERAESILALRDVQSAHVIDGLGHLQEVIVQNFRAKDATAAMADPDVDDEEYLAAVATTRLVMGPDLRIQAPPNLSDASMVPRLLGAGVDDWGGVSPLTVDHVNPERPWPHVDDLAAQTAAAGFELRERLTVHPPHLAARDTWIDRGLHGAVARLAEATTGLATTTHRSAPRSVGDVLSRAVVDPQALSDREFAELLTWRGRALDDLAAAADELRRSGVGDVVTVVVNRNLGSDRVHDPELVTQVVADAVDLGATEICIQGTVPVNADVSADVYCDIARAVKTAVPGIHLHAFRPADVIDGAARTGRTLAQQLAALRAAGVDTVPGTGVKLLDERIRAQRFPDDVPVERWIESVTAAHALGLRSTSVMFYGHGEEPLDLARHLLALRELQARTGGFTELVPMAFSPQHTDVHRAVHAVARLALNGSIRHIQAAWTRMGVDAATTVLRAGADDLGGTLYDGRVLPEAGVEFGQELSLDTARATARLLGRRLRRRTTTYEVAS